MLESRETRDHLRVPDRTPRRASVRLKLERRSDGQLWALREGIAHAVHVNRCFPWTEPTRYLSLRSTDDDEEIALIRDASELEPGSRRALEQALVEAGFVLEVEGIDEIEEEIEIRTWKVRTRQGPRSFQTPRDEWPREVPGGGMLIRDVAGDLFYISDPDNLDKKSRRILWPFMD